MRLVAYIGIGSNLADPVRQVHKALEALGSVPGTTLIAQSSLYSSKPMGPAGQPDYVNAVAALDTRLSARQLLAELMEIEHRQGRQRGGEKWGPRVIDLDLLLYGKNVIKSDGLVVPHPFLHERDFVIIPLEEIAGDLGIPGHGCLSGLVNHVESHSVTKLVAGT